MDIGLLVLRVVVGTVFAMHGTQKLFGWFDGYGLDGTAGFLSSLRFRQPKLAAFAAGSLEVGAGILLASGFMTPLAAAAILGVMINAVVTVNWSKGLFNGGYELDLLYAVSAVALAFTGAGAYSVDAAINADFTGGTWGLFSVALGIVVAGLVLASRSPAPKVAGRALEGQSQAA